MPTYRLSARNQFRTPSGAVGEAPDGPGGMAALSDDIDNYLGIGGAEYCASTLDSVPAGRRYKGKMAYHAPSDVTYRYMGAGQAVGGGTASWQAWSKPPTYFSPTYGGSISGTAPSVNVGVWGISEARVWFELLAAWNGGPMTLAANGDATVSIPTPIAAGLFNGVGTFFAAGSTAVGSDIQLNAHAPNGGATNAFRVRALTPTAAAYAANVPVRPNLLGAVGIVPATGDALMIQASGPSALTY